MMRPLYSLVQVLRTKCGSKCLSQTLSRRVSSLSLRPIFRAHSARLSASKGAVKRIRRCEQSGVPVLQLGTKHLTILLLDTLRHGRNGTQMTRSPVLLKGLFAAQRTACNVHTKHHSAAGNGTAISALRFRDPSAPND
uniref:Uncharacterized protein n=1 Tax=Rhipicephalus zambeziensis TaxID=60191 RepID=A0A224Y7B1_9ACAR